MQKITPFLWFNDNAEEAVNFYLSIFKNSRLLSVSHYGEGAPLPAGTVLVCEFEIEGQRFRALNGGPMFKFTEAVSFQIDCETQEEIDYYWDRLLAGGGETQACGWLKDKYGLSWQVTPRVLGEMLSDSNKERAQRVMEAMMQMVKLDIATLQQAYS